jgi:hypothetical protein
MAGFKMLRGRAKPEHRGLGEDHPGRSVTIGRIASDPLCAPATPSAAKSEDLVMAAGERLTRYKHRKHPRRGARAGRQPSFLRAGSSAPLFLRCRLRPMETASMVGIGARPMNVGCTGCERMRARTSSRIPGGASTRIAGVFADR